MCKFFPVLQAQILDIASTAGVGKCKSETFSILSTTGLPLVPPLRFIVISPFIQCYLFYDSSMWKELFSSFHPSCINIYLFIESLPCCVWENVQSVWVIYPQVECSSPFYVIYFMLAWLECDMLCWHFMLSTGTCVMCKLDMEMWVVRIIAIYSVSYFVSFKPILMHVKLQFRK
jgi:hypothetical protein